MMRAVIQVDRRVAGWTDRPTLGHETRGGTGGSDLEHLAPVAEPGAEEAAQED